MAVLRISGVRGKKKLFQQNVKYFLGPLYFIKLIHGPLVCQVDTASYLLGSVLVYPGHINLT